MMFKYRFSENIAYMDYTNAHKRPGNDLMSANRQSAIT